jgi:hypothetical protein
MKKSLITVPIAIIVLVVAYLMYDLVKPSLTSPCESIFQQSSISLKSNLEIIRSKGEIFIGPEKIQDLTGRAQTVSLNLKTCCVMSQGGKLSSEEFLKCKSEGERYQGQMENFAQQVDSAAQSKEKGDEALAGQKLKALNQLLASLENSAEQIQQRARQFQTAQAIPTDEASGRQKAQDTATSGRNGRINLIAAKNGGQVLVASDDNWLRTIDGKEGGIHLRQAAVFAFKDERPATFDLFCVLVLEERRTGLRDFELLVGNESPLGPFESIGKFRTVNAKLFKTPCQEFKFPRVTAKYLKVRTLSNHIDQVGNSFVREFQLWGTLK